VVTRELADTYGKKWMNEFNEWMKKNW
jgi:hypothetical protein